MTYNPTRTKCPVADCSYGDEEPKGFEEVVTHTQETDDPAHDRAVRRRDWTYEYEQIE